MRRLVNRWINRLTSAFTVSQLVLSPVSSIRSLQTPISSSLIFYQQIPSLSAPQLVRSASTNRASLFNQTNSKIYSTQGEFCTHPSPVQTLSSYIFRRQEWGEGKPVFFKRFLNIFSAEIFVAGGLVFETLGQQHSSLFCCLFSHALAPVRHR